MKRFITILAAVAGLNVASHAAAIGIAIDSGGRSLQDENGAPLSAGALGVARDGTQVILGYFTDATASNPYGTATTEPFAPSFVALTGPGTPAWGAGNSVNNFTIGDDPINGGGNGELFKDTFAINTGVADSLLPAPGTPLTLRFFNASGQRVLDLANPGLWTWRLPATPASSLNINLDDPGLFRRGTGSLSDAVNTRAFSSASTPALRTAMAVPEPSSVLLLVSGVATVLAWRRKR